VYIRKAARYSEGALLQSMPTGVWKYEKLSVETEWAFMFKQAATGTAIFYRPVMSVYQKLEEWDVLHEEKCSCIWRDQTIANVATWSNYVYDYTGRLLLAGEEITKQLMERGEGTAWMSPQNFLVDVKDPSGVWHRGVASFAPGPRPM